MYKMLNQNLYHFNENGEVDKVTRLSLDQVKSPLQSKGMIDTYELTDLHSELNEVFVEDISKDSSGVFVDMYSEIGLDVVLDLPSKITLTDEYLEQLAEDEIVHLEHTLTSPGYTHVHVDVNLNQNGRVSGSYEDLTNVESSYTLEEVVLNYFSIDISDNILVNDVDLKLTDINEQSELMNIIEKQVQLMFEGQSMVNILTTIQDIDGYIDEEVAAITKKFNSVRQNVDKGFERGQLEGYEATDKAVSKQLSNIGLR